MFHETIQLLEHPLEENPHLPGLLVRQRVGALGAFGALPNVINVSTEIINHPYFGL